MVGNDLLGPLLLNNPFFCWIMLLMQRPAQSIKQEIASVDSITVGSNLIIVFTDGGYRVIGLLIV